MSFSEDIQEYLDYIVDKITEVMPVTAIYLFGSYATGNTHEYSDIDLYIVTPDKSHDRHAWAVKAAKAIGVTKKIPIDLKVNYTEGFEQRSKMKFSLENIILETGVNLYEKR